MIPIARTENLLIQEVGNELIIYDQDNNSSHCLTFMAVRVWELSNGQHTVNDIAQKLEKEFDLPADSDVDMRGLVWMTLEELERYSLIKEYVKKPIEVSSISRRKVIKTATLVGGFAIGSMFPLVRSIIAPNPAIAGNSPTPNSCKRVLTGTGYVCEGMCGNQLCTLLNINGRISCSCNTQETRCGSQTCLVKINSSGLPTILKECPSNWCECRATGRPGETVVGTCSYFP